MTFLKTILLSLAEILNSKQRYDGFRVAVLMCLNALLDFFSLALFLPLIVLVVSPDYITSNPVLNKLYQFFHCSSAAVFIVYMTIGVLGLTFVKNILSLWITKYRARYIFGIGSELSQRMLSRYAAQDYLNFSRGDFSKELNRITNLPLAFANNIVMPISILLSEGLITVILIACATVFDVRIFLLMSVILLPVIFMYSIRRKHLEVLGRALKEQYPKTIKYALLVVEGLPDIKAFGAEGYFKNKFTNASNELSETMRDEYVAQTRSSRISETVAAVVICSIVVYSVSTSQEYSRSITLLSVYAGISFRIFPSINRLLQASFQLRTHAYLFEELSSLKEVRIIPSSSPAIRMNFVTQVELRNVSFEYRTGVNILNDISFSIFKGEKLGLVGKSGSGKTTLMMLILQLLDLQRGQLIIDGKVIDNKDHSWKSLFAYVAQNPYIIDGSVAENIAFGHSQETYNIPKIWKTLALADMDQVFEQYPKGIDTGIGEKGIQLSGGQRQRIAIARALYTDAPVLLFDEITNQLDAITESEILKTIDGLAAAQKTILMITHRQDLLRMFDRVLTIEDGQLFDKARIAESSR